MAKKDEISSTEKLLDLIRRPGEAAATAEPPTSPPMSTRIGSGLKNTVSIKKATTVGVDIGYDDLKLVKIQNVSPQKHELIDFLRVPFEPDLHPGHHDFARFLRKNLTRFCGSSKNLKLWSCISSARVELRYLKIPKVSQKQLANAVYWSHKKVAPYKESEAIFDFEILGEIVDDGTPKYAAVSFTAPEKEVIFHKNLFSKSGFPLEGVSIVPFAFQNLLRTGWIASPAKTISGLYIGRDWSRIDIFSGGNLVLSRGIKAGIKTMNEAMRGMIVENEYGGSIDIKPELVASIEGEPGDHRPGQPKFDSEKAQKIFFALLYDVSPKADGATALQPEEEEIFRLILPALKRLVQQVERTFDHYAANFDNERVEKLYISSTVRPHRRIVDYIGDELGLPRETFDPFATQPKYLGEIVAPTSAAERGSYAPAIGMALSSNSQTPNFLYTYKEKGKAARTRWLNKVTAVAALVLMGICVGIYGWQNRLIDRKKSEVQRLESLLSTYQVPVSQSLILGLVEKTKKKNQEFLEFSRKYLGAVALTEISNLTPPNVRLTGISVHFADKAAGGKEPQPKNVILEGLVLGDRTAFESALAGYLIQLSGSPLFKHPVINQKEPGFFNDKEVLRFTAQLKLI
ncbi:MAG: hypothetical protein WAM73_01700 [Desulfobacterales bacterium]